MKSKIRFFIIGSLIFLGILTGWIIPSNAAALNTAINVAGMAYIRMHHI